MIYLGFDGLGFKNEITNIVRLYFEEPEISIGYKCPQPEGAGVFLYGSILSDGSMDSSSSTASQGSDSYIIVLRDAGRGVTLEHTIVLPDGLSQEIPDKKDSDAWRGFKREVRRGVYRLLSEYTGIKMPWGMLTGIRPVKIVHNLLDEGLDGISAEERLKGNYFLSPEKARLITGIAAIERRILKDTDENLVSIYIGIPFCSSRCLYCSFTSNLIRKGSDIADRYLDSLIHEMDRVKVTMTARSLKVQNIYIGGGTPTVLENHQLERLLQNTDRLFVTGDMKEFTLEAGRPDSIDQDKLRIIAGSQVNRISINPQTMNDETLKLIGRNHTSGDIVRAFEEARKAGIENINMDVIIGLPGENAVIFGDTLRRK
jgi:oxygen-independent coproporphyrinogen-3 oxidase